MSVYKQMTSAYLAQRILMQKDAVTSVLRTVLLGSVEKIRHVQCAIPGIMVLHAKNVKMKHFVGKTVLKVVTVQVIVLKGGLAPTVIKNVQITVKIASSLPITVANATMGFLLTAPVRISFIVFLSTVTKHTVFNLYLFSYTDEMQLTSEETMTMMVAGGGGLLILTFLFICFLNIIRRLYVTPPIHSYGFIETQENEMLPLPHSHQYTDPKPPDDYINTSHRLSVDEVLLCVPHKKLNHGLQREFKAYIFL